MVIDSLINASKYYGMSKGIEKALRFLQSGNFKNEPGNYEIDGPKLYYLLRHSRTKPMEACSWEAHRKYIDIHYIIEGEEYFGYANINQMKTLEYVDDKDKVELDGKGDFFKLQKGFFALCDLDDAHMPLVAVSEPQSVKRIVVKIIVD